jgi:hypothetical protein
MPRWYDKFSARYLGEAKPQFQSSTRIPSQDFCPQKHSSQTSFCPQPQGVIFETTFQRPCPTKGHVFLQAPLEYALSTNGGSGNCKHSMRESRPEAARYNHCRDFVAVSVERRLSSLLPRSIGRGRPSGKGRGCCQRHSRFVQSSSGQTSLCGALLGWQNAPH